MRWSPDGKATRLPALPGHTWTDAFGINDDGIVSGWSRKLPNEDGAENPVLWDASGKVVPLKTAAGRADGIAEATNRSGLTVGYLGNLGTDGIPGVANTDPERDNAVVWQTRAAAPRLLGRPAPVHFIAELVDVNDSGQAAGMSGYLTNTGFEAGQAADLADRLDVPEAAADPGGITEEQGDRHSAERHQQPRPDRRQRLRPRREGLLQVAPDRPRPVDVPVRRLT